MPDSRKRPRASRPFTKTVEGRKLRLWIVKPEGWKASDRRPGAVFFHGGGWTGGSPPSSTPGPLPRHAGWSVYWSSTRLLSKGRGKDTTPPLVCCQDAKSAMRWVRSHAGELGIDPAQRAAGGGSAGGHLAAFTGMVEGLDDPADDVAVSARPNALILFNPVFDNGPNGWGNARSRTATRNSHPPTTSARTTRPPSSSSAPRIG